MCEQDKMHGMIGIPVDSFIKEHVHLIDVLKHCKKAECHKEGAKQEKELKRVMGHPVHKEHLMMERPHGMKIHAEGSPLIHHYH